MKVYHQEPSYLCSEHSFGEIRTWGPVRWRLSRRYDGLSMILSSLFFQAARP